MTSDVSEDARILTSSNDRCGERPAYVGRVERGDLLREPPVWLRYLVALAVTVCAVGLRRWLDVLGEGVSPLALFYPAVLVSALFGGVGPGLLCLGLCTLAAITFWLEPIGLFALSRFGWINLGLFLVTSGAILVVAQLLRSAYFRLRQSEMRLSLAQDVGQIGVWELNLKTGNLWWSPMFFELTGLSRDDAPSIEMFIDRIEPADREHASKALEAARNGQAKLDVQFRFNRDDGKTIWLAGRAELFRDEGGMPSRLVGINFDATSTRNLASEHGRASAMLETFFDSLPGAAYAKDVDGRILLGNPGFAAAVGHPPEEFLGKTDLDILRDKDQARAFMAHDRSVIREGLPRQLEEDLLLPDGRLTHWLSIKTPFRDADGNVQGIIGISLDMTERLKAEMRSRFLADEVDHRAKNLLAVVQSIVRLTKAEDIATFRSSLSGRIQALARAHGLLAASRWEGADLATLVQEELAPFASDGQGRIRITGPRVILDPNSSQALAMVLHELAINAVRHGALSVDAGNLTVSWRLVERSSQTHLELAWIEARGPAVSVPEDQGFGSTAIRGAIEHQLNGELDCNWAPTGLECTVTFPLERHAIRGGQPTSKATAAPLPSKHLKPGVNLIDKRVLIVEDEAFLALTLKEMVEEFGCQVTGPASNVDAAISLLRQRVPDVAILDVNLAGRTIAPVARLLRALGVPFIYCTGYANPMEQIDPELEAPIIIKPADELELGMALRRAFLS